MKRSQAVSFYRSTELAPAALLHSSLFSIYCVKMEGVRESIVIRNVNETCPRDLIHTNYGALLHFLPRQRK